MMWMLIGCEARTWTVEAALAPHRGRLDDSADGRVDAVEYDRRLWNGPPFATADADGDGDLSALELATLVRTQSSTSFDAPVAAAPIRRGGAGVTLPPDGQRDVWELLVWMGDALRSAGQPGPDPGSVASAVHTGRLESPETLAVLGAMRPAWTARGWTWPEGVPAGAPGALSSDADPGAVITAEILASFAVRPE